MPILLLQAKLSIIDIDFQLSKKYIEKWPKLKPYIPKLIFISFLIRKSRFCFFNKKRYKRYFCTIFSEDFAKLLFFMP